MDPDTHQDLLTPDSKNHLVAAGSWARFIGIIGFVFTAFFGCLSLVLIFGGSALMNAIASANPEASSAGMLKGSGMFIGLLYLIITAIYFLISWWTFRFGTEIKQGLMQNSSELISSSFVNLKNYFQAFGILTLIAVSLMLFTVITFFTLAFFNK